uniref:Uncharacterized protein n=1 Tax=Arundo donax TaxID=35708 RepID=A0A0A9HSQ9_ARUDO
MLEKKTAEACINIINTQTYYIVQRNMYCDRKK